MNLLALNPMVLVSALPGNVAQGVIWGIMAVGLYMTFRLLHFSDLTVDGSFATGGAVAVIMIISGWPAPFALLCAFCAGMIAGLVTGILHTVFGIPDILSGILTQIALYSINLRILGGKANQAVSVDKYSLVVSMRNISRSLLVGSMFALVLIILLYWFFGTELGCSIRATGCNPAMSKAQGININYVKVLTLSLSNGFVALSGGLLAQYQGFADVNMGRGAIVIGLAAVIIGEVLGEALFGKQLNFFLRLIFVVFGGIIYYIVIGVVLWLKMPANDLKMFTAAIVALFLAIPYLREKSKNSYSKAAKNAQSKAQSTGSAGISKDGSITGSGNEKGR